MQTEARTKLIKKMPEENEEISTYFENENYKKLKDGRKR